MQEHHRPGHRLHHQHGRPARHQDHRRRGHGHRRPRPARHGPRHAAQARHHRDARPRRRVQRRHRGGLTFRGTADRSRLPDCSTGTSASPSRLQARSPGPSPLTHLRAARSRYESAEFSQSTRSIKDLADPAHRHHRRGDQVTASPRTARPRRPHTSTASRAFRLTVHPVGGDTYGLSLEETYGENGHTLATPVITTTAGTDHAASIDARRCRSPRRRATSQSSSRSTARHPIPLDEPSRRPPRAHPHHHPARHQARPGSRARRRHQRDERRGVLLLVRQVPRPRCRMRPQGTPHPPRRR